MTASDLKVTVSEAINLEMKRPGILKETLAALDELKAGPKHPARVNIEKGLKAAEYLKARAAAS